MVKADGYGHGADGCAEAALAGGATWLAVATAAEAAQVGRRFQHVPLLTMGALTREDVDVALSAGSDVAVWREGFRSLLADRARAQGRPARVHVKHDSGMGRLGNPDPTEVMALARACDEEPRPRAGRGLDPLRHGGRARVGLLRRAARAVRRRLPRRFAPSSPRSPSTPPTAPPSSATRRSHFDMARCGIAVYGLDPFQRDPAERGLVPALSLHSYVADVKRFAAGDSAGYGQTWRAARRHLGRGAAARLRRRGAARPLQQRRGAGPRPPSPARRHRLDGQRDDRPRPRDRRRARGRGGADRRPGRGDDPRRGGGGAPRHDQLRGHLRDLGPGPAAPHKHDAPLFLCPDICRKGTARRGGREPRRSPRWGSDRGGGAEGAGGWGGRLGGRRRGPRRCAGTRGDRPRPRRRRRSRGGGEGDRPRGRRPRLRALRGVRHLEGGGRRRRLAGRRLPAAR